ncbi:MAG: hypothetical protein AB7G11_09120 [Phycisphaerales bacterium]
MPAAGHRSSAPQTPTASAGVSREFTNKLIRVMYERRARCPDCRYSLDGLIGHRCPECGRHVEELLRVADTMPRRWAMMRRRMLGRRARAALSVVALVVIAAAAGYTIVWLR